MSRAANHNQEIAEAYASLDLAPGADLAQVKAAYRRLARALHPDHNPGAAGTLMARVNQAYSALLAHLGDQPAPRAQAATAFTPYVFESFDSPRRPAASRRPAAPAQPADSAPLAAFTRRHELDIPWASPAPGSSPRTTSPGWRLVGLSRQDGGVVYQVEVCGRPQSLTLPVPSQEACATCAGSGRLGLGACPACGGRGHFTRPRQVRLDLPRAWFPGQRLTLDAAPGRQPLEVELRPASPGGF